MGNNNNRGGGYYSGGQGNQKQQNLAPKSIKIDGFYDGVDSNGEKTVKKDLFDTTALDVAKTLGSKEQRAGVSSTQLRRFFDEVKRYDMLLETRPDEWKKQEPYIRMLKSKIAYSVARVKTNNDRPYYKNLSEFMNSCIDNVKSQKDYHIFASLFEAVYGFYYELAPKN